MIDSPIKQSSSSKDVHGSIERVRWVLRFSLPAMFTGKLQILIVDDNPADVGLLIEAFQRSRLRHEFHVAADGEKALDFLSQGANPRPNLILLDLNLPGKNGHEVLKEIKENPLFRQIPVVVFSSSLAIADVDLAYDLHANCYIQKPANLDEFWKAIDAIDTFWAQLAELPPDDLGPTASKREWYLL